VSTFCIHCGEVSPTDQHCRTLKSAVERLREIAALKGTSKRQRVNSELAISWLLAHGYALTDGGYLPGKGFVDNEQETENVEQR
jgi:hypothetical protein